MQVKIRLVLLVVMGVMLFPSISCQETVSGLSLKLQSKPSETIQVQSKVPVPSYNGEPAIIFRMDDVAKGRNEEIVESIIRLFGKNNVPLNVSIIPCADGRDSYEMPFLKQYVNAGIIDISIHGNQHIATEFDTTKSGIEYQKLKSALVLARSQIQQYFGVNPVAFTVPYDYFSEDGYNAVQDSGFKIFSTQKAVEPHPSIQLVNYTGNADTGGMSRLCTVSDVATWDTVKQQWGEIYAADIKNELFSSVDWGLNTLGVAVVSIHPQAFLNSINSIDDKKLEKLDSIVKLSKQRATITTFEAWYQYALELLIKPPHQRVKKTPAYTGGPAVIFRMDDAEKGFYEETTEQLIKVFQKNGIPLDVGVMPLGAGRISYDIPFLLRYLDDGVIDISMHGYKNTFLEFDTKRSGTMYNELDETLKGCFKDTYGNVSYTPTRTSYEILKDGLIKARDNFRRYFGEAPVSFTVPYDIFNEDGYRVAQDAGFKVFSSIIGVEPYPSVTEPVNYFGRKDPNGMYRLPSLDEVAEWDDTHCKWGSVLSLANPSDSLYTSLQLGLTGSMGLAVLRLHPQVFIDAAGKPDPVKLNKLDAIIKYILEHREKYGQVITFQSWYEFASRHIPQQ
jgi:peptidoglycan/xylan/chitin deacetylase (PgdA/CDA1 family)